MNAGSIEGVLDVTILRGATADDARAPDLLIEVPHGATKTRHFDALRAQLAGPFPGDLVDFFHVNTDVGAPEAALALARHVVQHAPHRSVMVMRCLIPRTFIDCNRVIDGPPVPQTSTAAGMTPGVVKYVTSPADLALLYARYSAYRAAVSAAFDTVCGAGGTGVMLHSYAPRSVDVPVDEQIVQRLRAAYQPDVVETWPLRAEVDLITKTPDGAVLADPALVEIVRATCSDAGLHTDDSVAYPLHPSSLAWTFASKFPGRTLCVELRRDLLVQAFTPFAEMTADVAKVDRIGGLFGAALGKWWARGH